MIVKLYRILGIILIFFLTYEYTAAQGIQEEQSEDPYGINMEIDFTTNFIQLLDKLDTQVNSMFKKLKIKRLDRKMGYLRNDIKDYLIIRRRMTEKAEALNYNVKNNKQIESDIGALEGKIKDMIKRIQNLSNDEAINLEDEKQTLTIESIFQGQQARYLTPLALASKGEDINEEKIKQEGRRILADLEKSLTMIGSIQEKLKKKIER